MPVTIPQHYSAGLSFEEQVLYVLSQLQKASASETAIELMELQGVSTEDGVADLTIHTEKQLEKLYASGQLETIKERHEKKRYRIKNEISS